MTKNKSKQTAINIVRRLPLLRHLNASQSSVVKITPAWQAWNESNLSLESAAGCHLSSLANGKLIIVCNNATVASQIKHQQKNLQNFLLNYLQNSPKQHDCNLDEIVIRIQTSSLNNNLNILNNSKLASQSALQRPAPSENALKAIKNCQRTVGNQNLANSLAKLAETLKNEPRGRE